MSLPFKKRKLLPVHGRRKHKVALLATLATIAAVALLSVIEVTAFARSNSYLKARFANQLKSENREITAKLNSTFEELRFISTTLTALEFPQNRVNPEVLKSISAYASMTPGVRVIRIIDQTGTRVIWSSVKGTTQGPLETNQDFIAFGSGGDELIGKPIYAPDFGGYVLATRLKVTSKFGNFYVSAPIATNFLVGSLTNVETGVNFTVYDSATGKSYSPLLGFGNSAKPLVDSSVSHSGFLTSVIDRPIELPWTSKITWNISTIRSEYLESAPSRWAVEAGIIFFSLMLIGFLKLIRRTRSYGQRVTSVIQTLESSEIRDFTDSDSLLRYAGNIILNELELDVVEFRPPPTRLLDIEKMRRVWITEVTL